MDIDADSQPQAGPSRPAYRPPPKRTRQRHIDTMTQHPSLTHPYHLAPALKGGGKRQTRQPRNKHVHTVDDSTAGDTTPGSSKSASGKRGVGKAGRKRVTRAQARRGSSSPTTDLEAIALEDAAVKAEIHRLGLGLRDVQGDGNCLFRAVADQLWGVSGRHVEVRKLVCDYLETNRESMEAFVWPFLKEGEDYDGYVERMRQQTQFGSHIEIQAAARVFRRSIRVIMSTTSFTIPWQTETETRDPPLPINNPSPEDPTTPRPRRTRSCTNNLLSTPALPPPSSPSYAKTLAEYIPPVRPDRSMLWLALFSQAEHFQSVRRKGDGDSGSAEIEDRLALPHEKDTSEAARRQRGEPLPRHDAPATSSGDGAKVTQVLASLPPGHGVSENRASGILARVKGDLGEAVEILLEELRLESSDMEHDSGDGVPGNSTPSSESSDLAQSSKPTTPESGSTKLADKEHSPKPVSTRSNKVAQGRGRARPVKRETRGGRQVAVAV